MTREAGSPGVALWVNHALVGVVTTWVTAVLVIGYAQRPGPVGNRTLLTWLAVAAAVGSVAFWSLVRIMARHGTPYLAFGAWSLVIMSAVSVALESDGGHRSPLVPVLFVVLVFPAFAYPWRLVLGLALYEIAGTAVALDLASSDGEARKLFLLAGMALTAGMVTLAAGNRGRQEQALAELTRRLAEQAVEDPLTGCLNRRGFEQALEAEVARAARYDGPWALVMVDVDHLKSVNDTFGHAAGDTAISAVADAMRAVARRSDVLGRLGGDEFAMLLPHTASADAQRLAERLHTRLREQRPMVTVSIGVAAATGEVPGGADGLMREADAALYQAKLCGRNRTALAPTRTAASPLGIPMQRA